MAATHCAAAVQPARAASFSDALGRSDGLAGPVSVGPAGLAADHRQAHHPLPAPQRAADETVALVLHPAPSTPWTSATCAGQAWAQRPKAPSNLRRVPAPRGALSCPAIRAMTYSHDYKISARRHLKAAEVLYALNTGGAQPAAKAVAGYLYGLAGELAVKQMMTQSGMRPLADDQRRNDPFYKHFPELKSFLLTAAAGRRSGELLNVARTAQTFQEWRTDMRYAPTREVPTRLVDGWQNDAKKLIVQMEAQ